mgnify:FL=1
MAVAITRLLVVLVVLLLRIVLGVVILLPRCGVPPEGWLLLLLLRIVSLLRLPWRAWRRWLARGLRRQRRSSLLCFAPSS